MTSSGKTILLNLTALTVDIICQVCHDCDKTNFIRIINKNLQILFEFIYLCCQHLYFRSVKSSSNYQTLSIISHLLENFVTVTCTVPASQKIASKKYHLLQFVFYLLFNTLQLVKTTDKTSCKQTQQTIGTCRHILLFQLRPSSFDERSAP